MKSINEKRREFLAGPWGRNPYPKVKSPEFCGRLLRLEPTALTMAMAHSEILVLDFPTELELASGYPLSDCLQEGDLLEVSVLGQHIESVRLLVPSSGHNPFGLRNFDVRRAQLWNQFLAAIRTFFLSREFVELRTPSLVPSPGLEPHLDPFKVGDYFLPTSPEFHLKKALTMGFGRCFEFKECFRNEEISPTHQLEFMMLEWYRTFEDTDELIEDVQSLFSVLQKEFSPNETSSCFVSKMEDLWKEVLHFELTPRTDRNALESLSRKLNLKSDGDFDELFHLLFLEKIEPYLAAQKNPTIVWHYPPSQAALSRLTSEGWADRFEVYWRGYEIANAFNELNDPQEQRRRFVKDQEKKEHLGKTFIPVDGEFLKALEWGMPPSVGIALGVERLFMAFFKIKDISDCRLFGLKRN